ncbi:MAG: RoPhREQ2 gp58 [Microbacterium sp.]|jgi:hypothetical protein|nr:RoPhREQ2 gp58 [Microbacterium sp.]
MDLTETTAPRSDQQNYDDVATTPRTVTIEEVRPGSAEQPVEIHLVEYPGRPYKPSKSMRRVLVAAWGADSTKYAGRSIRIYGDPTVKFGGQTTGGIKLSHLSDIDAPLTVHLTATRGKRAPHTVEPLPSAEQVAASTDQNELRAFWDVSGPERRAQIKSRVAELKGADQ